MYTFPAGGAQGFLEGFLERHKSVLMPQASPIPPGHSLAPCSSCHTQPSPGPLLDFLIASSSCSLSCPRFPGSSWRCPLPSPQQPGCGCCRCKKKCIHIEICSQKKNPSQISGERLVEPQGSVGPHVENRGGHISDRVSLGSFLLYTLPSTLAHPRSLSLPLSPKDAGFRFLRTSHARPGGGGPRGRRQKR